MLTIGAFQAALRSSASPVKSGMTAVGSGIPAAPARQQSWEQRPSAPARLGAADPPVSIGRELPLVALELCPINVAFMVILQQDRMAADPLP